MNPVSFRPRNLLTYQKHRREVFWQITLPTAVGGMLLFGLGIGAVVAAVQSQGDISRWSHISLILLILPTMFMGLILIIVLAGVIYLLTKLLVGTPYFANRVQDIFSLIGIRVEKVSQAAAIPFLRLSSFAAALRALRRGIYRGILSRSTMEERDTQL